VHLRKQVTNVGKTEGSFTWGQLPIRAKTKKRSSREGNRQGIRSRPRKKQGKVRFSRQKKARKSENKAAKTALSLRAGQPFKKKAGRLKGKAC